MQVDTCSAGIRYFPTGMSSGKLAENVNRNVLFSKEVAFTLTGAAGPDLLIPGKMIILFNN